jgi:hypothetical protein
MSPEQEASLLARYLTPVLPEIAAEAPANGLSPASRHDAVGAYEPDIGSAVRIELSRLLAQHPDLRHAVETHAQSGGQIGDLAGQLAGQLAGDNPESRQLLWALLGGQVTQRTGTPDGRWRGIWHRLQDGKAGGWVARKAAGARMNAVITVTVIAAGLVVWQVSGKVLPAPSEWGALALRSFALWCLAFVPGWLYVRFIGQRAGAVWSEYVLHLHRLGWDEPGFLPRPPRGSAYFEEWVGAGGLLQYQRNNIYRLKFNAFYGKDVSDNADHEDFRVRPETMFPIFLTTAVLAVGWVAVLWDPHFVTAPASVWDMLKFAFLGAYAFIALSLIRRFFVGDLRPSAYASAFVRIAVVLITTVVLHQIMPAAVPVTAEAAAAFVVGFFPLVGLQVLNRFVAKTFRWAVPQLVSDYPLNQIDGLDIWYESRLVEEGIEDMQNLVTANFVDIMLHTRVPVGRLVDWVDQALLYLHLDRVERGSWERASARRVRGIGSFVGVMRPQADLATSIPSERVIGSVAPGSRGGTRTRTELRQLGIRTATDLLRAFPSDQVDQVASSGSASSPPRRFDKLTPNSGLDLEQIRILVRVLDEDTRLAPIWNWQGRGVAARCPAHHPRDRRANPSSTVDSPRVTGS